MDNSNLTVSLFETGDPIEFSLEFIGPGFKVSFDVERDWLIDFTNRLNTALGNPSPKE